MWTKEEEDVLRQIGHKSYLMSNIHRENYKIVNDRLKYFRIPIIILSGINSIVSVGFDAYFTQDIISMTTCVLALVCGIIGSIELFLKLNENMQIEFISGREFSLLHIDISKTLRLKPEDRGVTGKIYLDDKYNQYVTLISNGQSVSGEVLNHDFTDMGNFGLNIPVHKKEEKTPEIELIE